MVGEIAWDLSIETREYAVVASEAELYRVYSHTPSSFVQAMTRAHERGLISRDFMKLVNAQKVELDRIPDHGRDVGIPL